MLIKAIRTGRKVCGQKLEPTTTHVTVAGVRLELQEFDTWSSDEHPGNGEYIRISQLIAPKVDPWPNIKGDA